MLLKLGFCLGAAVLVLALVQHGKLPDASRLRAELFAEPDQQALPGPLSQAAFRTQVGGVAYTIEPSHRYEIRGLVVSKHNANAWWDWVHAASKDHLNVTDLCVIWGRNASAEVYPQIYRDVAFSSGQWTCNFETASTAAYQAFNLNQIANNHVLTDNPRLATALRHVRIGDQIQLTGYLVTYRHQQGMDFVRTSSTVRTDTGNGACEVVFAEDFRVLRAAPLGWLIAGWAAALGMVGCVAAGIMRPHRAR